jgi:hypothetical protein
MPNLLIAALVVPCLLAALTGCARVTMAYDADGKTIGEVFRWDDRIANYPLNGYVRYPVGGDHVALVVSANAIVGLHQLGGSTALFTTPDCSGNDMFMMVYWPPLMKRYAAVLPSGEPGSINIWPTQGWLWATPPLPLPVNPAGIVFHSQWTEFGTCSPYPPPGYTVTGTPFGGYWMHRVEELYAKFKRPYWSQ